ncbi:hypothetical protein [Atlanticothrix silvestris]|nr:hypothetical protein [Atlanticothrix silvestris]
MLSKYNPRVKEFYRVRLITDQHKKRSPRKKTDVLYPLGTSATD